MKVNVLGSKKVYWPPGPTSLPGPAPLTSRLDSNASNHTVTGNFNNFLYFS